MAGILGASLAPSIATWLGKNYGINYGLLFTSWGIAGLAMSWATGRIKDATGKDDLGYFLVIGLLALGALLTFVSRALARRTAQAPAVEIQAGGQSS